MEMKWILVLFGIPLFNALTIQDTTIQEMSIEDTVILDTPISDTTILETPNLETPIQENVEEELVMTTSQDSMNHCMNKHNEVRNKHHSPDIKLDQQLCSSAQDWADHLAYYGDFQHSGGDNGENLYASSSSDQTKVMEEAVAMWYDEVQHYNYNSNSFQKNCGHFTQCVWASSTSLGCGVAWDDYNQWNIVVCQYYPPGNVEGQYKDNVKRPSSKQYFSNVTNSLTAER